MPTSHSEPRVGFAARVELLVGPEDTAEALGSGDVPVLGTPRLVALCEQACAEAVAPSLRPGWTSVGVRVQFDHLAPVNVGRRVAADAVLDRVEGRKLLFTVAVTDEAGLVGAGRVTRVSVERQRFLDRAR